MQCIKIGEWIFSGKVWTEKNSDDYYFKDKETVILMEVFGDVIITKLPR